MPLGAARITLLAKSQVTAEAEVIRKKVGVRAEGNAQIDTAQSKFGGASAYFDGDGDYLKTGSILIPETGDFTIECWVRLVSNDNVGFISQYASGDIGRTGLYVGNQSRRPIFRVGTVSIGSTNVSSLSTGTWHHLAGTRNGNDIKLWVNGVLADSGTSSANVLQNELTVGVLAPSTYWMDGHIDEVRVSDTVRYTSGFTPSTTPFVNDANTLLLLHMDGTDGSTYFEDDNGTGRSPVGVYRVSDGEVDTAQSKFGGTSAKFADVLNGYIGSSADSFDLGSGDFTVEMWAYFTAENTRVSGFSRNCLMTKRIPSNVTAGAWGLYWDAANSNKLIWEEISSGGGSVQSSTNAISTGSWQHIAAVRSGSTITLYVDGTSVGSGTLSTDYTVNYPAYIGYWGTSFYSLNGWIDELRVSSTARYTSGFTPSTTPFINDENTLLLLHMDGTDASTDFPDDNGTGRAQVGVSAQGNAQIDTAQSQFGGSSLLGDGTGDYLQIGTMSPDQTEFTIECWIYPTDLSANAWRIWQGEGSTSSNRGGLWITTPNHPTVPDRVVLSIGDSSPYDFPQFDYSATGFSTNTWYHIAVSRDSSGDIRAFVNGTQVGSAINNTRVYGGTDTQPYLGYNSYGSEYFIGNIDEFRFSDTARYTANFTPPTEAFQNDENTLLLLHMDGTDGSTVFIDDNGTY